MRLALKKIHGNQYPYLEHSYRVGGRVRKKSLYFPSPFTLETFDKLNQEVIHAIARERAMYIRAHLSTSRFFTYGDQLEQLEADKILFQVFRKLIGKNTLHKIMTEYIRKFLVNSMVMEGATITYHDATAIDQSDMEKRSKSSATLEDKRLYLQLKNAFSLLQKSHLRSASDIRKLHNIIYEDIYSFAGQFRKVHVTFGGAIEKAITSDWHHVKKGIILALKTYYSKRGKTYDFERIIQFHIDYQRVHPFQDGNSRLGRLIMAHQLLQYGYPPLLFGQQRSTSYRNVLVKAVNQPKRNIHALKYFYEEYQTSYKRFWKPIIEKKITEQLQAMNPKSPSRM